ncbi:hypothetical protein BS17DRAFT_782561 [Gyrodon lividus]|nr:hypothetical protein BS17DRAFT_782561 [Gyrodon lividus]
MVSPSQILHDINQSTYKLDLSGVVGLFGGNSAVTALQTIHLYKGRRWAGWYNYSGTTTVARTFGQIAKSRFWDSVFPGPNESATMTFGLAGKQGPRYSGAFSGTDMVTGYLGYLTANGCTDLPLQKVELLKMDGKPARETGTPSTATIIYLPQRHGTSHNTSRNYYVPVPKHDPSLALVAIAPSLVSIMACVACVLARDQVCAFLISLGIMSSGISSLVFGTATLSFRIPVPSEGSPPGDGLMYPQNSSSLVLLKGDEADVNVVTKGEFELDFSTGLLAHPRNHTIAACSFFLMIQFLAQLLLMPRSTFFGQITYLISFIASGVYHLYVASHEKEKIQRELLHQELGAVMERLSFGTRTQMAVFLCLVLGEGREHPEKSDPNAVLTQIIPNDTPVWKYWRKKVVKELERYWQYESQTWLSGNPETEYLPDLHADLPVDGADPLAEQPQFSARDRELFGDLVDDSWSVLKAYPQWRGRSNVWQEGSDDFGEQAHLLPVDNPV